MVGCHSLLLPEGSPVEDNVKWPTVVGITAGVIGGLLVGLYLYMRAQEGSEHPIRDAQDVIAKCYEKIQEIESGLSGLKQPTT